MQEYGKKGTRGCEPQYTIDQAEILGQTDNNLALQQCQWHCDSDYECQKIQFMWNATSQIGTCRRLRSCVASTAAGEEGFTYYFKSVNTGPAIASEGKQVSVREIATVLVDGSPARLNSLTHWRGYLIVGTETSGGRIYQVDPATGNVTLFFDVAAAFERNGRAMSFSNYQHGGLRAVAFHPDFETNGLFYVSAMESRPTDPENFHYASDWNGGGNFGFSGPIDADSVVVEFKYNLTNNSVIEDSYRLLFRIGMPVYDHPIKYIAFNGSYLFIAHGDGSVQSAITGGGQGSNALGKILRINPLYVNETTPYTIPSDNPYLGDNSFPDEVFAVGFRNPHTFCFSKSGELIVGEAGRDNAEEVNIVEAGHDYGWSQREGFFVHNENGTILKGVSPLPDDDAVCYLQ
uniref:Glucose/Sorbosone dehydrogenase domain-containing protein n=1 Tax=Lotharella globosa TaxID=91324 RepID=A0A7S3YLE9_9EUKA